MASGGSGVTRGQGKWGTFGNLSMQQLAGVYRRISYPWDANWAEQEKDHKWASLGNCDLNTLGAWILIAEEICFIPHETGVHW